MRPNTPHVVFTAESAVCLGGHYYATSTLRDTCYGVFHSFVAGSVITNASHVRESFMVFARMVVFYHDFLILAGEDSIGSDEESEEDEEDEVAVQRRRMFHPL